MELQRANILSPVDPNRATKVFGGSASGILNWNDLKYPYFYELREEVRANFWIAAEVDLSADTRQFSTYGEREELLRHMALLAHHSDRQNELSSAIVSYATDPSVTSVFATMYDQNSEHNHALAYALGNFIDVEEQQRILRVEDAVLTQRLQTMDRYAEQLRAEETEEALLRAIAYLAMVKGLHYFTTFTTFYERAERGEMKGMSELVGLIHRDRFAQLKFVGELFRVALAESEVDRLDMTATVKEMLREELEREQDHIQDPALDAFIRYRANRVLRAMGLQEVYPEVDNPIAWIDRYTTFDVAQEQQSSGGIDLSDFDDL